MSDELYDLSRSDDPQWVWDLYHGPEPTTRQITDLLSTRFFAATIVVAVVLAAVLLAG